MTDEESATPTADTPSTGPDAAEARGWIGSRLDEIGGAGGDAGRAAELSARGIEAITAGPAT
jgi:hypothetical protein